MTNVLEHVVNISNTLVHVHDSYQVRSSLSLFQKCHLSLYSLFFFPKHGNTPKCYSSADNIFFLYFTETKHKQIKMKPTSLVTKTVICSRSTFAF